MATSGNSGAPPDYFDRQKRIPGWNQDLIEQQVCFCFGLTINSIYFDLFRLWRTWMHSRFRSRSFGREKDYSTR